MKETKKKSKKIFKIESVEQNKLAKIEADIILGLVILFFGIMVGSVSSAVSLYNGSKSDDVLDLESSHLVDAPVDEEDDEEVDLNDNEQLQDFLDSLVADQTNFLE